jgi:anti-sigma B factor antagonist
MEFYYHDVDTDVLILKADGGLNAANAGQFVDDLEKLIESGIRKLIVDCSRLEYISSTGLATLMRLHKRLWEKGGHAKLAALGGVVVRILEITRLNTVFEVYTTVDDARRAFHEA